MRDFLELLKCVYAILGIIALSFSLIGVPIWLAVEFSPWWAMVEIIATPVGLAVLMWGACKINEM